MGTLAGIFRKETSKARKEEPRLEKVVKETRIDEGPIPSVKTREEREGKRSLANAQPLREFDQMDWIPLNFEEIFDKREAIPKSRKVHQWY